MLRCSGGAAGDVRPARRSGLAQVPPTPAATRRQTNAARGRYKDLLTT